MKVNLDDLINQVTQHPRFLKLKNVVENNAYHDHEDVYSHLLKTAKIAKEQREGKFITNKNAKDRFAYFMSEEFESMKRMDIVVLIALLHDIGKILHHKDGDNKSSLIVTMPYGTTTMCPGHEYWGSTIVGKLLKDLDFSDALIQYIANVVRLHDTFSEDYFKAKETWPIDLLLDDVKSRAENLYKEALFNVYCDCYTAKPFQFALRKIEELFNEPSLYTPREYFVP